MNLDLLEIQRIIEEKRLIWGRKLEIFLLNLGRVSATSIGKILNQIFLLEKEFFWIFCGFTALALLIALPNRIFLEYFSVQNFSAQNIFSFDRIFFIVKNYLFPVTLFLVVALPCIKKQSVSKKLFFAAISAALIILTKLKTNL